MIESQLLFLLSPLTANLGVYLWVCSHRFVFSAIPGKEPHRREQPP